MTSLIWFLVLSQQFATPISSSKHYQNQDALWYNHRFFDLFHPFPASIHFHVTSAFLWLYHTFQRTIRALTPTCGLKRKETGSLRNKIQEKKEQSTYCQLFSTLSIKKRIRSLTEAFQSSLRLWSVSNQTLHMSSLFNIKISKINK